MHHICIKTAFLDLLIIIENCLFAIYTRKVYELKKKNVIVYEWDILNPICNLYTKSFYESIPDRIIKMIEHKKEYIIHYWIMYILLLYMCYHFVLKIKRSLLLHAKLYDISNEMHILNSLNVLILFVKYYTRHWEIENSTPSLSLWRGMYLKVYIWISFIVLHDVHLLLKESNYYKKEKKMHLAQYRFYLHSTKLPSLLQSI